MPPASGPGCRFAADAGGADVGRPGVGGPGVGGPGMGGTGPGHTAPGAVGPGGACLGGAWPEADPGPDHQMVAPGSAITWLSCGIGPVPAIPRGADSGGGAGSAAPDGAGAGDAGAGDAEPEGIAPDGEGADAAAPDGEAAAGGDAEDEAAAGEGCWPADGAPWGRGREGDPAAAEPASAAEPPAARGFFSHQR